MNDGLYNEIIDLYEMNKGCFSDGEKIICFEMIKQIVEGSLNKENISYEEIALAKEQLLESFEWFGSMGVSIQFQQELLNIISLE